VKEAILEEAPLVFDEKASPAEEKKGKSAKL